MSKIKISAFTISLDGYGAGPEQSLQHPMGHGTENLHQWMLHTRMFHAMQGKSGGTEGVDNDFAEGSMRGLGAWIMGRNMFTPERGPWADYNWKGWWGEEPPYHVPVFVLSHHPREPLHMKGGSSFYFVTDGIESALRQAREAAGDKDIRIGGGVSTVRQFLQAGLVDEMHLVVSPVLLGKGEHLLSRIDLPALGLRHIKVVDGEKARHYLISRDE